ncbi:MAG: glutathione S-transferase family protein [Pseudomonadota bacterium]
MELVGRNRSPFVRRVAISAAALGIELSFNDLSIRADRDKVDALNPIGRVPILILDDGERLIDSAAILDYFDEFVGPARALLPPHGASRRRALQLTILATGIADRAIQALNAPDPDSEHAQRHVRLVRAGMAELDAAINGQPWFLGDRLRQPDISASVAVTFIRDRLPEALPLGDFPALSALTTRCERLDPFLAAPTPD